MTQLVNADQREKTKYKGPMKISHLSSKALILKRRLISEQRDFHLTDKIMSFEKNDA